MRKLFGCALFLISVVLVAELLLRGSYAISWDKNQMEPHDYLWKVYDNIYRLWLDTNPKSDPFRPPLLVFSNKDFQNEERLKGIFEATKLPPSSSWTSYDFIQGEQRKEQTKYNIHSNSLGFRGREYSIEKKKRTYRVIVLGSYQAFGHGVEDDKTYPARMEGHLNTSLAKAGYQFEVWNGGRHAGSAIVGLARMKFEIFKYQPDLIILDYGFVDTAVWGDNFFPVSMRFPDDPAWKFVRTLLTPFSEMLSKSYLWQQIVQTFILRFIPERQALYDNTLLAMVDLAESKKVPVIMLKQMIAKSGNLELLTTRKNLSYIDVGKMFSSHPFPSVDPSLWKKEPWSRTWLLDLKPEWLAGPAFENHFYRLNLFQLNEHGNELLGSELADIVAKKYFNKKLRWN